MSSKSSASEIVLPANDWRPRPRQLGLWNYLENGGKRAIAVWHRRFGKDEVCLNWAAVAAFDRPATYWHMLPEYSQGRKAIWTAVNPHTGKRRIDEAFPHEIREKTVDDEMFIRFRSGATWQVVGSDRYNAAVGSPPAGITFSEWALSNPAAWGYLAPILTENNGWAVFITTSRGRNHAKSMLDMARKEPSWFAEVLTVDDTGAMSREAVEAQRREYQGIFGEEAGDALIDQEYFCSFEAAVLGAYYGKALALAEKEGRIREVPINPDLPVQTAWDIGIDDPMAIWAFQVMPGRINVVDYYESSGHGFKHYTDWLKARGYQGPDWVPHDARVRELGAGIDAGAEDGDEESDGGRTRIQTLIALGRNPQLCIDHKLMDGINAARLILPLCHFDEKRCAKGLECLREYKADWDDQARVFKKTPAHNWASHGADGFRTLAMGLRSAQRPAPPPGPSRTLHDMTLDELWDIQDKRPAGRARV